MAGMLPIGAIGIDNDPDKVDSSRELALRLEAVGWFQPGSTVSFEPGDVYELPYDSSSFDLVTARFLFQHLTDPRKAVSEIKRVLKPGGKVCVIDIDDGLSITYPEMPAELTMVMDALFEVQGRNGGDRSVGRKISTYLEDDAFEIDGILVMAEATHSSPMSQESGRTYLLNRIQVARQQILDGVILTEAELEGALIAINGGRASSHFILGGHLAVLGTNNQI
jgi:SAM-dependent methyltransferase